MNWFLTRLMIAVAGFIAFIIPEQGFCQEEPQVETASPVSPEQDLLNVGDQLVVIFLDRRNLDDEAKRTEVVIQADGTVLLPLIGEMVAVGKTSDQLEKELENTLKRYIVDPFVRVELLQNLVNQIALLGAVNNQGLFPFQPGETLIHFIAQHGGLTSNAEISQVNVIREPGEIIRIDLTTYFEFGDMSQDIPLQGQDRIFIPIKEEPFIVRLGRTLQAVSFAMQIITILLVLTK